MFYERLDELFACIRECTYTTATVRLTKEAAFDRAQKLLQTVLDKGGIIYVIGDGNSASIAAHFSNLLMYTLQIPSQTLLGANLLAHFGSEEVFSYPLEKMLKPCDLLIAISNSGESLHIVNAASTARQKKAKLITLSGFSKDNPLRAMGALNFWINRKDEGLIEASHFFLLRTIADYWDKPHTHDYEFDLAYRN